MNKKHIKYLSLLLCILLVCVGLFGCSKNDKTTSTPEPTTFNLDDYQSHVNWFRKEINIGKSTTREEAVENATSIFLETFGKECVEEEKPYHVCYDEENKCWYVYGDFKQSPSGNKKGGVAKVIFDTEGNVLALWHEK